jgi:hypothetical protein
MAFNMGGGSKTSQTQHQLQVGVESGVGYGGASGKGAVGGGGVGNITGGLKAVGVFTQVNTMTDHDAVRSSFALGQDSLEAMQSLSTLAVGYANQNSNQALLALQSIGTQAQVAAAGGSPAEVAGATTTTAGTVGTIFDTKQLLIIAALALGGFILWRKF